MDLYPPIGGSAAILRGPKVYRQLSRLLGLVMSNGETLPAKEALMLNRAPLIGLAIAFGTALFAALLVNLGTGPRLSRADLGSTSISIEDLHRQVSHTKLPIHSVPEP